MINVASGASFQACSWSNRGPNCLSGQEAWLSDARTPCPPKTGFQAMNTNYGITKFMQVAHMKALAARERLLKSTLHAYSLRPGYVEEEVEAGAEAEAEEEGNKTVSYTHLTLPTISSV